MRPLSTVLIAAFLHLAIPSLAATVPQDVVYLKNGGVIRGIVIEQVPGKSIKIQTRDQNIFVFTFDEIERITREPLGPGEPAPLGRAPTASRYMNISRIGVSYGSQSVG